MEIKKPVDRESPLSPYWELKVEGQAYVCLTGKENWSLRSDTSNVQEPTFPPQLAEELQFGIEIKTFIVKGRLRLPREVKGLRTDELPTLSHFSFQYFMFPCRTSHIHSATPAFVREERHKPNHINS